MKSRFLSLALGLLLVVGAIPVFAQEQTASIQGEITDQSGAPLPGVTVEAVSNRGRRLTATSDSTGHYRFPSVPPGIYTITATLAGMEPAKAADVQVTLGSTPNVDLKMRVGAVTEALTVTAEAPLVDVTSSATTASIRSETFEKLPKGRDFSTLVTMLPSANFEAKQGAAGTGGIQVDGASGSENRYVVDGVDTTNPQTGVQGKLVKTSFVDEVQVKSAGYQAEFGGAIGGVINVITKTGTNDFAGSVGVTMEDSSLNGDPRPILQTQSGNSRAFEFFQPEKDDETIMDPGFAIGGPILRDRLWFFGAYEPTIQEWDRTVTFTNGTTNTFNRKFTRDSGAASLSASLGTKLLLKAAYNNSGYEDENILPDQNGRGSSSVAAYEGQTLKRENWSASGYADFVATPSWFLSARGGRYYDNLSQGGIPDDPYWWFAGGSPNLFPEVPANLVQPSGFRTPVTANSAITKDAYTRDNLFFDVSWFPQIAGAHRIKAGVQFENLKNEVNRGFQNYVMRTYWGQPGPFGTTANQGKYGMVGVYVFKTFGNVESKNTGFFLQDSWTTMSDRLTLNIGVRAEQEKVPNYADPTLGLAEYAINFDYGDKLAPRFGFAYDLFGTGRSKIYGSWGKYFDITKMEMPRGSFGGDKWIWFNFAIDEFDWTKWNCTNVTTSQSVIPTCTGGLRYVNNVDLRHPSLELIEPDLKPMESEEFTIGGQHELSSTIALGARYVNKRLIRTIEDVGVLVEQPGGGSAEEYFIANPGSGVAKYILAADCPSCEPLPKAKRDYQAFELEMTKRFSSNWGLHASYVYSRLYGNYSGLASSDENGRNSPNVNRYFDNLFNSFDASGSREPVYGKLATDRPHVFKAQLTYGLPWGTILGVSQYVGSGTPLSTEFYYHGVPFFAYGRGDMGRTPTLSQTNLALQHDFRVAGRYGIQLGMQVLNLLDQDTAVNYNTTFSTTSVSVTDPTFFDGFDPLAKIGNVDNNRNPLYGQPNQWQDPRSVRFHAKFTF